MYLPGVRFRPPGVRRLGVLILIVLPLLSHFLRKKKRRLFEYFFH